MTALTKYDRLEASGLWRASPEHHRQEVIVSIGDATLIITDIRDNALTHWSLAAVERANPGSSPAIFHPDGDTGETLELARSEKQMIDAIEKLQRAIDRARPRPGRLRWTGLGASVVLVLLLLVFWLPGALVSHTVSVVPQVYRASIGNTLLNRIQHLSGPACSDATGVRVLERLGQKLETGPLTVLPGGVQSSLHLPGGRIVLNRALVEDYEEPDVVAGFILEETLRQSQADPLRSLLETAGLWASFRLLTTGELESHTLDRYAEHLLTTPKAAPDTATLLARFAKAQLRSTPYAYARDVTGETVLGLIEADPMSGQTPPPLLSDADWLRLQNICEG